MAITKLMNIKDTGTSDHAGHLNRLLTYMMNPEKTQEEAKIGAVNCIPESASITMQQTKDSFGKVTGRQGYHFVISFKPGETDADTAYKIAEEFISEYLADKYETVFAVHDDKEHIHIHIAFNSVSFVDGYKYHYANNDWAKIIQPIVNRLTSKEGLSTVELDSNEKHDRYKDHNTYRDGADNFSDMIKRDIDVAIAEAYSYDEFLQIMKDRGYEIKEGKYLAFRGKEMSRFRRCKKETLGIDYTEEAIRNRIPYESLNTFRAETEEEAQKIVYSKIPRGKRAKLSPVQKKYFARLYRLKLIQRRPYSKAWQFRDEIKKMHKLEEQYLFLVEHDITSLDHLKEVKSDLDSERRKVSGAKSKNYRTGKKLRELYQVASEMSDLLPGERLFQSGDKEFETEHNPLGENHPAVKQYNKCMRGAGDTVRSIIISANSRLAFLENQQVLDMLSEDDLKLAELGIGVNGDGRTKTALFCVIPDNDKSYNFIIGMLYTQIFQELYYQADFNCGGRLPIHVTFMLDEFANVALPDDYCSLLSTMRSREISSVIIIQNLAQIKALFKDTWETIPGNCDTLIYLGGNEQSTHKYISELLGKATIDKRTNGETRGRQGSSSRNYDVLGRELLTPDEARKFENEKCLIFIRGFDPIMDEKYKPMGHPAFSQTADGGAEPYVHTRCSNTTVTKEYEILTPESLKYYEGLAEKGENVFIDKLSMDEMTILSEVGVQRKLMNNDEKEARAKMYEEVESSLEYVDPAAEEEITTDMNKVMKEEQEADKKAGTMIPDNSKTSSKKRNKVNRKAQQLKYPSEAFSDEARYNADRFEKDLADNKISVESGSSDSASNADGGKARVIHRNVGPEATLIGNKKNENIAKSIDADTERKRRIEEYNKLRTGEMLPELIGNDTLVSRIGQWHYSAEQKAEMHTAFEAGMSSELILEFFYPDMPVVAMRKIITRFKENDGNILRNK